MRAKKRRVRRHPDNLGRPRGFRRLQAAVPLVLENGFDGCYEAGRVEVRASTGLAGARTAAQGASRAAARPARCLLVGLVSTACGSGLRPPVI